MHTVDTASGDDRATPVLHAAGLRTTAPRRAVLGVLEGGGHFEAAQVFDRVRTELPGTSLQAVYGVLAALVESGIARKIDPEGGPAVYETRRGDNHHHLLCLACGRIEDVACVVGEAPCLTPSRDLGFHIQAAEVTFKGVCPDCHAAA